jgi:hypothetical protein
VLETLEAQTSKTSFSMAGLSASKKPAPRAPEIDHDSESRQLPKNKYLNTLVLAVRRLLDEVSGRACVCSFELEPKEK